MDDKPKKYFKSKIVIYALLIIFTCLYFAGKTGYYDKKIANNSLLTKEAIMKFEKDVASGKAVDITDYVKVSQRDYRSLYSKIGYNVSDAIDKVLNNGVTGMVKVLKSLFT